MLVAPDFIYRLRGLKPPSKTARRLLEHMEKTQDGPELCADGRVREVRRFRLDMRCLDRSKYNGDGRLKKKMVKARKLIGAGLIAVPFVALFTGVVLVAGWWPIVGVFGIFGGAVACIGVGSYLMKP